MRHEAFYRMADAMGDNWTAADYKAYAHWLNALTGRGNLGRAAAFQPQLNALFISPRKIVADIQVLTSPVTAGTKAVRIEATKTLVRYTAALGTLAIIVNASGKGKVGLNPDDPDFLKLRIGNTRFDLTGGTGVALRTAWRIGAVALSPHKYGKQSAADIGMTFLGNKESPGLRALGMARKIITGDKDMFLGRTPTGKDIAVSLFEPWNANGIREAWQTDGAGMGVAAGLADFWGVSTQSYIDRPPKRRAPKLGL
jgi:hypothetical protein